MDAGERLVAGNPKRRAPAFGRINDRAHFPKRRGHAFHGTARQTLIPGQLAVKALSRHKPREQTHGGPGITHIERAVRRLQAVQTHTVDAHETLVGPLNGHAHIAEGLQSGQAVLAFQKALYFGDALGQRAQHDGAMGYGLIAGNADIALNRATGLCAVSHLLRGHGIGISLSGENT